MYAIKDDSRNAHFAPCKFYAPLESVLEFQRMFSQTQVLSSYFEERKKAYMEIDKGVKFSLFIADWVYFHWWKYQKVTDASFRKTLLLRNQMQHVVASSKKEHVYR